MTRRRVGGRVLAILGVLCLGTASSALAQSTSFTPPTTYDTGHDTPAVALADLNHDGFLDLVVATGEAGAIRVRLGDGTGAFGAEVVSPLVTWDEGDPEVPTAFGVAVADFNGDTFPDVATAADAQGRVYILFGDGTGAFPSQASYPVGAFPEFVLAADFDNDGHPDLATPNQDSNDVTVLLNDGTGAFTEGPGSPYAVGSSPPYVRAGYFNGDASVDLIVPNPLNGVLIVLLGTGAGSFTFGPPVFPVTGCGCPFPIAPFDVGVLDFNGDGFSDLAVTDVFDGTLALLAGNGDGTFDATAVDVLAAGSAPFAADVADFNGDGLSDVVVADEDNDVVLVFEGNGTTLNDAIPFSINGVAPEALAVGDANGDGKIDLAVGNFGTPDSEIFLNDTCCFVTVTVDGTGVGIVTSATNPDTGTRISCGPGCIRAFQEGTEVTLTAVHPTSLFTAWGGVCAGTLVTDPCVFTLTASDVAVNATFDALTLGPGFADGTVGQSPYDVTVTTSTGTGPYSYLVTTGGLPPGLLLTGTGPFAGQILGTPTQAGVFPFTIQSTDANGAEGTQDYAITINQGPTSTLAIPGLAIYSDGAQTVGLSAFVTNAAIVNSGSVLFTVPAIGCSVSAPVVAGFASAMCPVPAGTPGGTSAPGTASYGGSSDFLPSSSGTSVSVAAAPSATTAANATATFNTSSQSVPLTAVVASGSGVVNAGTVTFTVLTSADVPVGAPVTSTVTAGATSAMFTLPAGTSPQTLKIAAVYSGSTNFVTSADPLHTLTVASASTTIVVANATASFSTASQSVPLSANVTSSGGAINAGTVTFTVLTLADVPVGSPVTSGTVTAGAASAMFTLPAGTSAQTLKISAVYNGVPGFSTSLDTLHTLTVAPASTTIVVANANAIFASANQIVPLSANVTSPGGAVNAGSVTFTVFDAGDVQIGVPVTSGIVVGGSATAGYTLPAGTQVQTLKISAAYNGLPNYSTSFDTTHTLTINAATTTTAAANATATFKTSSQTVLLTANITTPGSVVSGGTVTFTLFNVAAQIGTPVTSTLVIGGLASASYTLPAATPPAPLTIVAAYSGTTNFTSSSDSTHTLVLSLAPTTTIASGATAVLSLTPQSVPLVATVSSTGGTVNTGSVTFTVTNSGGTVGAPVTAPVVGQVANAVYTLPGGTPAQTLTVTAAFTDVSPPNFGSSSGTAPLTIGCSAIEISPSVAPPLRLGYPFTMTLTSPSVSDAVFSFTGTPPPGLTVNGATLSGTPTTLGLYTMTATATSAASACTGSRTYTLSVLRGAGIVTGAGGGAPRLRTFDGSGNQLSNLLADDPAYTGGIRVAMGDVTGDGIDDIITAPGRDATAATVRVIDGSTLTVIRQFEAYPYSSPGGTYVAAGDVNGDGRADIVTGRDGSPPEVKVFDGRTGALMSDFFAYPLPAVGGVRVAAADVDGDGFAEIITGQEGGGTPEVRIFSGGGTLRTAFMAYYSAFTGGVFVAAGDIDGDGRADIITGADAGGAPHVLAFSGADLHVLRSFFAYTPFFMGGVRVAAGDIDGDGRADIVTAPGASGGPHVRVWSGATGAELAGFFAYEAFFAEGVYVAAPSAQSRMEIGIPGPGATVPPMFAIGGWAGVAGATVNSGVDAIHAWAWPVAGGSPIFLGATTVGVARPDVAAIYGGAYALSGFNLAAGPVPAGTYTLVVYAHSSISGTWALQRLVRIVVTP
jgi:hypothetical protein